MKITLRNNTLVFNHGFALCFQRTLRIPDDGKTYPLPPGLGLFPIMKVRDYLDRVPETWREQGGVFIPMYQREALWLSFIHRWWKPNAIKVGVGKVNAVSGKSWDTKLSASEKDYLVSPPQPWLDGINAGEGFIRQFVAMPLGLGYTVEAQVTGEEKYGGLQIIVYEAKQGKFPDKPPENYIFDQTAKGTLLYAAPQVSRGMEMGLAAGGRMRQQIYPDPHGIDTWDEENTGEVFIHIVNSLSFSEITGLEPPETPISVKTYMKFKLPWFDLYDEDLGDIAPPKELIKVKSISQIEKEKGLLSPEDEEAIEISEELVHKYQVNPKKRNDMKRES
jgi:hypothetical protein